jgi:hypothetical protein
VDARNIDESTLIRNIQRHKIRQFSLNYRVCAVLGSLATISSLEAVDSSVLSFMAGPMVSMLPKNAEKLQKGRQLGPRLGPDQRQQME